MADDTVVVHEAGSLTEADLVVGLLMANGIPAMLDNESATVMLDGYVGAQRVIKVRAPASAGEAARALIASVGSAAIEDPDEEE